MSTKTPISDPLGEAIADYYQTKINSNITIHSSISDEDVIPVDYLFRSYKNMPDLEKTALQMAKGSILDIGCGAGSHSIYLMGNKEFDVLAIDISEKAIDTCKKQGIPAIQADFFEFEYSKFDTLLFLMNGIGICGTVDKLPPFFEQCKKLLNKNGQILLDSSDIIYMYEDEDGEYWIDLNKGYYGEVEYKMQYKKSISEPFKWLFIDFNLLQSLSAEHGFNCELIKEGSHFDYLAKLTLID